MLMPEEAICKEELYFRMCLRKDTVVGGRRAPRRNRISGCACEKIRWQGGGVHQGGIVFPDVLAKRYGGRGEACTRGRLRSEQVPQWLRRRNREEGLTAARSAFSTRNVCVSPGSLIRPNHSSAMLALSYPTPYVKHRNTGLIKF
jgi:hypothetical protein